MKYKCLKENWFPYSEAFEKYIKKGDNFRFINKVPEEFKEKIGRVWFVDITWFKAYSKGKVKQVYVIEE